LDVLLAQLAVVMTYGFFFKSIRAPEQTMSLLELRMVACHGTLVDSLPEE
jgi:hypothetical protein